MDFSDREQDLVEDGPPAAGTAARRSHCCMVAVGSRGCDSQCFVAGTSDKTLGAEGGIVGSGCSSSRSP